MNTKTFTARTKNDRGNAIQMVKQWIQDGQPIRPVSSYGGGRRTTYIDHTSTVSAILARLKVPHTTGNDAPRGGAMGKFIQPERKAWAKFAPIRKAAEAAKAEKNAKEQTAAEAKRQAIAKRFEGIEGKDVFLAWWKSETFHPAPAEVIRAKEQANMTWKEVHAYCKAHK